jgi:hypothetical protein
MLILESLLPVRSPTAWGLGKGLRTPYLKIPACYEMLHRDSESVDTCEYLLTYLLTRSMVQDII